MINIQTMVSWSALLLLLACLFWLMTSDDWIEIEALEEAYTRRQLLLTRLESLPAQEAQIKRKLADLGNEAAASQLYEGDHNQIQSLMQKDLRQLASDSAVRISRMRAQRHTDTTQYGQLTPAKIQLALTASHETLVAFLAALEAQERILKVERLVVRVERTATRHEAARLAVSADIVGFRQQ
jgi:Tfp pilus assembly protein PilO